jgi:hypothetical protein
MLGNRQTPTYVYLSVLGGKITKRVPEGTQDAIARTNKMGVIVHEMHYDFVEGILIDVAYYTHDQYGAQWIFTLQDGAELYRLQASESARALTSLLLALPNCDLKKPIAIHPYDFTDAAGKNRAGVSLRQGGKKIEWYFTREEPKGLPELKPIVTDDGKEAFDNSERMQFLRKYVEERIAPQLPGIAPVVPPEDGEDEEAAPGSATAPEAPDPDDLPF